MSQAELSKTLDTTPGNVNRWAKGDGVPSYELCRKLLLLGMTIEELFGIADYRAEQPGEFSKGTNGVAEDPSFKNGVYKAILELKKEGLL